MRSIFLILSLLGILVALAVVSMSAKKQLTSLPVMVPGTAAQNSAAPPHQAIQQQYKQALDAALQPARPDMDDK